MAESSEILTLPTRESQPNMQHGVYVIGLGGIGSWLVEPVMRFLHSKKMLDHTDIILVDGDKYEASNRNRQIVHPKLIGMNKADATAQRMRSYFPESSIIAVPQFISTKHGSYFKQYPARTWILSCSDNNVCRLHLSQIADGMDNVTLLTGGNEMTDGNSHLFHRTARSHQNETLLKKHPEIAEANDGDRSAMSCEQLAALPSGGQIIVTNFVCASTMLMHFYQSWEAYANHKIPDYNESFFDINKCAFNSIETRSRSREQERSPTERNIRARVNLSEVTAASAELVFNTTEEPPRVRDRDRGGGAGPAVPGPEVEAR
jgi:hypothetical protein